MSSIQSYSHQLTAFSQKVENHTTIDLKVFEEFEQLVRGFFPSFAALDRSPIASAREQQQKFRAGHQQFLSQSYFVTRAGTWPRGYAGDFETLEGVYKGAPVTEKGLGLYFDNYFLTRTLARGVRERKNVLRDLLLNELKQRPTHQKVLDIACGSSREVYEMGPVLNDFAPEMTFLDYDADALKYSENILYNAGIDVSNFRFLKANAFKLAVPAYVEKQFGKQDIIYSAGLFDYIKTDNLQQILASLYANLNEDGVLIAPFKDCCNYETFDYHWLADWSYFYQRSLDEVRTLILDCLPEGANLDILPTKVPAINFFVIRK